MQKTSNNKKTFLPVAKLQPSQKIYKSLQKVNPDFQRPQTQPTADFDIQQAIQKINKKRNFQYYFFDKYNSTKQLYKLRNSPSTKALLQKELLKSVRLDNELDQKAQQIIEGKHDQNLNIPFYIKQKPLPIQNDQELADYGQFYRRKNLKKQVSPSHHFQKLKQNKQNVYKYRQTRGMISPSKKNIQKVHTERKFGQSSKYNRTLSPFEFKNTIEGRLLTRSDRNLRMDLDKTRKINNVNKVWSSNSPEVEKQNQQFLKMRKSVEFEEKIKKCHSFDSYKGHKLFESRIKKVKTPADQKFYDPDGYVKDMPVYQRWKTKNNIDMAKTTDRPKLPEKLGTHLEYQIPVSNPAKQSSKKYQMGFSLSERNLFFTRQVINPVRGCYR